MISDKKHPQTSNIFKDGKTVSFELTDFISNGDYQEIFWLGVAGFVIVNPKDRDIVMVDPWPTYASSWTGKVPLNKARPLKDDSLESKARIQDLANFIRRSSALETPYRFSAVLLSHMHFDHTEDVALLLELLHCKKGAVCVRKNLHSTLDGPPLSMEQMPVICGDFDTIFYLKTQYFGVKWETMFSTDKERDDYKKGKEDQFYFLKHMPSFSDTPEWKEVVSHYGGKAVDKAWREVTQKGKRLYYDDVFNDKVLKGTRSKERPQAGTAADPILIDSCSFEILPTIWDHLNTPPSPFDKDSRDDISSGNMQRVTAFRIAKRGVDGAKRTFIVGSSGEMNSRHTEPAPPEKLLVETDLLIQATTGNKAQNWLLNLAKEFFENFSPLTKFGGILGSLGDITVDTIRHIVDEALKKSMDECREATFCHINIRDYLVYSHFEEFTELCADKKKFKENFTAAIADNIHGLKELLDNKKMNVAAANRDLLKNNAVFVLKRRGAGFEGAMPHDATNLRDVSAK